MSSHPTLGSCGSIRCGEKDCRLPHGLYVQLRYWIVAWQAWIGPPATHHWRCMSGFNVLMSTSPHINVQEEIQNRFD
jgi:hypothetical protein